MARYGFTYTLPTITGSHSDFPVILTNGSFPTAAIDGGASSILNGGGNLRAYTDDTKTTQLPVEIVTFVTGGTPNIVVHIKVPSAFTGATIYIEADTVAVTQPVVTDTYGRNAVWTGRSHMYHGNSLTDVTGNGYDLTANTGSSIGNGTFLGGYYSGTGNGFEYTGGSSEFTTSDSVVLSKWVRYTSALSSDFNNQLQNWYNSANNDSISSSIEGSGEVFVFTNGGNTLNSGGTSLTINTWYKIDVVVNQSANTVDFYVNGVLDNSVSSYTDNSAGGEKLYIDEAGGSGAGMTGDSAENSFYIGTRSADYIATEYDNQSDPDNWGTSSAWTDQDAGGGVTADIAFDVPAPTFSVSATATLPNPTADIAFDVPAPTFSVSATATLPNPTADIAFDVPAPTFSVYATVTGIELEPGDIITLQSATNIITLQSATNIITLQSATNIIKL